MVEVNAVDVNVANGKSTVSVLRPLGELVAKPFNVYHIASELKKLADFLKSLEGEPRVIMEHAIGIKNISFLEIAQWHLFSLNSGCAFSLPIVKCSH